MKLEVYEQIDSIIIINEQAINQPTNQSINYLLSIDKSTTSLKNDQIDGSQTAVNIPLDHNHNHVHMTDYVDHASLQVKPNNAVI
ncbi:unnamed protein product [Ambrosiozyma monospora]|uniref:Unnamed protein product n=1 Tax=Ambrosiozyma monospora TaxID=43982 RepID=A0A9W7DJ56_AMBMO|nr:unnamed protein product [Ambrosiozyma monospora]